MTQANLEDVVNSTVDSFIRAGELFTAVDVSNKVKEVLPFARHKEVRDIVRGIFQNIMQPAGYARTPITVTLNDGTKTDALLYHPLVDSWDLDSKYDSQKRNQNAKSHVAPAPSVQTPQSSTVVTISTSTPVSPTSARALWEQLFNSQPSMFPQKRN